jgi:hypothetical protein
MLPEPFNIRVYICDPVFVYIINIRYVDLLAS